MSRAKTFLDEQPLVEDVPLTAEDLRLGFFRRPWVRFGAVAAGSTFLAMGLAGVASADNDHGKSDGGHDSKVSGDHDNNKASQNNKPAAQQNNNKNSKPSAQQSAGKTQGRSGSNPDGGGVDKPYAAAGQPAKSQGNSDWDGNNGCGNDNDRSDDNNGNCGGVKKNKDKDKTAVAGAQKDKSDKNTVKAKTFKRDKDTVKGVHTAKSDKNTVRGVHTVKSDKNTVKAKSDKRDKTDKVRGVHTAMSDTTRVRGVQTVKTGTSRSDTSVAGVKTGSDSRSHTTVAGVKTGTSRSHTTVAGAQDNRDVDHKTIVCHVTGSGSNPFVRISIDRHALNAHMNHGDVRPGPGDTCPPAVAGAGHEASASSSSTHTAPAVAGVATSTFTATATATATGTQTATATATATTAVAGAQAVGDVEIAGVQELGLEDLADMLGISPSDVEAMSVDEIKALVVGAGIGELPLFEVAGVSVAGESEEAPAGEERAEVAGVQVFGVDLLPLTGGAPVLPIGAALGLAGGAGLLLRSLMRRR